MSIIAHLEDLSERFPDRPIFFQRPTPDARRWEGMTCAQMLSRVHQYAAALRDLGLTPGDAVAIMLPTSLEWECCDKALLAIGCTVVGIDVYAPPAYLRRLVSIAKPRALIVQELWQLNAFSSESLRSIAFVVARNLTSETEESGIAVYPWVRLTRSVHHLPPRDPSVEDRAATVIFTSGTTGEPKGIVFNQQQLLDAANSIAARFSAFTERDRTICWLPMSNLFQRMINLSALQLGIRIYYHPDPLTIMDALRAVRPTIFVGVPRIYQRLYRGFVEKLEDLPAGVGRRALETLDPGQAPDSPSTSAVRLPMFATIVTALLRRSLGGRLRMMVSGSAPCPVEILHFFRRIGIPLLEAYGVSESATPVAINSLSDWKIGSVGKPLTTNSVKISGDGEVLVFSPGLCQGYLGSPQKQLQLDDEGFYHTGDDGYIDADGFLFLTGRRVDIAKLLNGRRVSLTNIERSIWSVPNVDQVVAFGHGRERVLCAIVPVRTQGTTVPLDEQAASIVTNIQNIQSDWPIWQRVRGVLILDTPFSVSSGELTPNLKLRRSVIQKNNAAPLKDLDERIANSAKTGGAAITWLVVTKGNRAKIEAAQSRPAERTVM